MFNLDVTQKCLIGECWCPVADLDNIQHALRRGTVSEERNIRVPPFESLLSETARFDAHCFGFLVSPCAILPMFILKINDAPLRLPPPPPRRLCAACSLLAVVVAAGAERQQCAVDPQPHGHQAEAAHLPPRQ